MNTKNNQRYQDTEKRIQNTLLALAQEKEIHKVTVRAICEAAHINRSSFCLHYLDIHDLIYKMGLEMMHEIGEMMRRSSSVIDFFLSPDSMAQMIDYVREHRAFFVFKAGFISVLGQWIHRGCPEAPEKLAGIILRNLPSA